MGRLGFDRYVLDADAGCLRLEGSEILLRPKTFAVLCHLVERPQKLVSKEELFSAVWPNVAITDDVLVQSIGELRRALGDDGSRLIRTVPRRGYRFEAPVFALPSDVEEAGASSSAQPPIPPDEPVGSLPRAEARPRTWHAVAAVGVLATALLFVAGFAVGSLSIRRQTHDAAVALDGQRSATSAIAVLPFRTDGADGSPDHFADGITQDVISALGRFPGLTVMSWNAVRLFQDQSASPKDISDRLAVRYYVEGKVHRSDNRIRLDAQLVSTAGSILWSDRFDEVLADVFLLRDRLATQVAGSLAIKVTQQEQRRATTKPIDRLEAYDLVLKARPLLQRPSRAGNAEARELLKRAIERDPKYPGAYAALAEVHYVDVAMGWAQSPAAALDRAEDLAGKALSLDHAEVRAHVILGRIHILNHQYDRAATETERAIEINASDAQALAGLGNILLWRGETGRAIEALELSKRIDPDMNAIDRFALSVAYYLERRYGDAIEQSELNLRSTAGAHFSRAILAAAYAQTNNADLAARAASSLRRLDPTFDAQAFGTKFLNRSDLEHLREGFRKAKL